MLVSSFPIATEAMQEHLVSNAVDPGAHAVLILDQAGWHVTPKLKVPDNITLMFLPPRSPELNPVENLWQFMRDNWLSNRVFKDYDDIVDQCCRAWNRLVEQPRKIPSECAIGRIGHDQRTLAQNGNKRGTIVARTIRNWKPSFKVSVENPDVPSGTSSVMTSQGVGQHALRDTGRRSMHLLCFLQRH